MLKNNRGSALISVILLAIILNLVFMAVYMAVSRTQKVTGKNRVTTSALTIAEAGKERLYGEISHKIFTPTPGAKVTAYTNIPLGNGFFTVSVLSNLAMDRIWVESIGKVNALQTKIECEATIQPEIDFSFPAGVGAAIVANGDVSLLGNITIDGRDHDTNGVVIGPGGFGVSTCDRLSVGGSSSVGGKGIAPGKKGAEPGTYEEYVPEDSRFDSPEAFLGLPPGALDKYKTTSPTLPIQGIVYLTSSDYDLKHLGDSYGILIVHNVFGNANLKINQGDFKGLIIVDQMNKINGNAVIKGAVVTLRKATSTFGNGNAQILYSSMILNNLGKYCPNVNRIVKEQSWREVPN